MSINGKGILCVIEDLGLSLFHERKKSEALEESLEKSERRCAELQSRIDVWMDKCDESDREVARYKRALAKEKARNRK